MFSETGVSQDFLDTAIPHILSFATDMFNDTNNVGRVQFPIALYVLAVTPFDDRDQIDRAISEFTRESMETRMIKTVPAAKASIEALKKVRVDVSCTARECSICLEEFCIGLESRVQMEIVFVELLETGPLYLVHFIPDANGGFGKISWPVYQLDTFEMLKWK
uniref:Uncharacterized protein n=1 Tax=Fagus sylvatica TaxID=28930 RepID=A0A2N9FHF9_FAGSY